MFCLAVPRLLKATTSCRDWICNQIDAESINVYDMTLGLLRHFLENTIHSSNPIAERSPASDQER